MVALALHVSAFVSVEQDQAEQGAGVLDQLVVGACGGLWIVSEPIDGVGDGGDGRRAAKPFFGGSESTRRDDERPTAIAERVDPAHASSSRAISSLWTSLVPS